MSPAVLKSWDDKQAGGTCIHLCELDEGTHVQSAVMLPKVAHDVNVTLLRDFAFHVL